MTVPKDDRARAERGVAVLRQLQARGVTAPTRRDILVEAARTPKERAEDARTREVLRQIGPDAIRSLRDEGRLPKDPKAVTKWLVDAYGQVQAAHAEESAERAATGKAFLDAARRMTREQLAQLDIDYPGSLESLVELAWRERASDPRWLSALVQQHGEQGAAAIFQHFGRADLLPLAAKTYLDHRGQEYAAKHPGAAESGDENLARLGDPAFQVWAEGAVRVLKEKGLLAKGNFPSPGAAVLRTAAELAEKEADPAEAAARIAEVTGGRLGTAEEIQRGLDTVAASMPKAKLLRKANERDEKLAKEHPALEPSEADKARIADAEKRHDLIRQAYEKHDTPTPAIGLDHRAVDMGPSAVRVAVDGERRAALAQGWAKITGDDVVLDVSVDAERRIVRDGERRDAEERAEAGSRRGVLGRAFDEIDAGTPGAESPRPTNSETRAEESEVERSESRRSVLSAEFDRLSGGES